MAQKTLQSPESEDVPSVPHRVLPDAATLQTLWLLLSSLVHPPAGCHDARHRRPHRRALTIVSATYSFGAINPQPLKLILPALLVAWSSLSSARFPVISSLRPCSASRHDR